MRIVSIMVGILLSTSVFSQKLPSKGMLSLGTRSTLSTFEEDKADDMGLGLGGQFRLQISDRINTEWFSDFIKTNIGNLGYRNTAHIGWSVMYYPLKGKSNHIPLFKPYVMMGHCFDYAKYTLLTTDPTLFYLNGTPEYSKSSRLTSAIQGGIGTHINLSPRFDFSLSSQYMIHIGGHTHIEIHDGIPQIHEEKGLNFQGHLLFTLSMNYKIANLW